MPTLKFEKELWDKGLTRVVGVDEVGMAALAGPVVAAACLVTPDTKRVAIASASIIAKVTRDRLMERLSQKYPGYGWEHNAGYPTIDHRTALRDRGLTPLHRDDFGTVKLLRAVENQLALALTESAT